MADDDVEAMEIALSCRAISEGAIVRTFEAEFGSYLGVAGAVATNSCTSALVLALTALDIGPGDDVAMPSYTCAAVMNAVVQVGATPRLADNRYDVPSMDYNVSAEMLAAALTPRTRAIIVPHMFGTAARIGPIKDLGLSVIEDITLSLGATHCGRPVGMWGDISVCSFHASKMIACGEGGMLASADRDLLAKARYLNGWADEQAAMRLSDRIEPYRLRYNFRMSDLAAARGKVAIAEAVVVHRPPPSTGRPILGPAELPTGRAGSQCRGRKCLLSVSSGRAAEYSRGTNPTLCGIRN